MERFLVIGGEQRAPRTAFDDDHQWYNYKQGIIAEATAGGEIETRVEYISPLSVRAADDPVLFKSGTVSANTLYVCTQTEVLIYRLPAFELIGYVSVPWFNDLHHVLPTPHSTLLVANSGLDMVLELTRDGEVVRIWNVGGEDPWERFSPTLDYRRGITTKPHRHHPNHLFFIGEEIWVTRFEERDAVCLTQPGQRIEIRLERVHDGLLADGWLYFTTVDANVVVVDPASFKVAEVIDLKLLTPTDMVLGWCRAIMIDRNVALVGFSRIRPTKFRETLSWIRTGFSHSLPTHIARYDLAARRHLGDVQLESHGINAVFSILPMGGAQAMGNQARSAVNGNCPLIDGRQPATAKIAGVGTTAEQNVDQANHSIRSPEHLWRR